MGETGLEKLHDLCIENGHSVGWIMKRRYSWVAVQWTEKPGWVLPHKGASEKFWRKAQLPLEEGTRDDIGINDDEIGKAV